MPSYTTCSKLPSKEITRAGLPTTTARGGTERVTTEPAQTIASAPISMRPTMTECAPMNTRLPMVGAPRSVPRPARPMVTFCAMLQL